MFGSRVVKTFVFLSSPKRKTQVLKTLTSSATAREATFEAMFHRV